jgi:hypothetical protein
MEDRSEYLECESGQPVKRNTPPTRKGSTACATCFAYCFEPLLDPGAASVLVRIMSLPSPSFWW